MRQLCSPWLHVLLHAMHKPNKTRLAGHIFSSWRTPTFTSAAQRQRFAVYVILVFLQLAASDAALYGWPSSTLLPLLDRMAALYNQELISLLAKPVVLALQQRRQDVVHAMFDVLVKEAALDQGDMLADALLLLAYQVGGYVGKLDVGCCKTSTQQRVQTLVV